MKRLLFLPVVSLLTGFFSCSKEDTTPSHAAACQLEKVYNPDSIPYAQFFYTDWGAPSHILLTENGTGQWDYVFYYDGQKRLGIFVTGLVRPPDTLIWTVAKYVYENDLIVRDTLFTGGDIEYGGGSYFETGEYVYDSYKRIIQYSSLEAQGGRRDTLKYSYLPEEPFINNHSILGGNKELMFVNRDYSKTNAGVAERNAEGYPTKFTEPYVFLGMAIPAAGYNCR